jgi:hypothetical protein
MLLTCNLFHGTTLLTQKKNILELIELNKLMHRIFFIFFNLFVIIYKHLMYGISAGRADPFPRMVTTGAYMSIILERHPIATSAKTPDSPLFTNGRWSPESYWCKNNRKVTAMEMFGTCTIGRPRIG